MNSKVIPKPTVKVPLAGKSDAWTAAETRAIHCNPIYIGHPLSEEDWVRGAAKMIKEEGSEQFLINLLTVLRATRSLRLPSEPWPAGAPIPYGFAESNVPPK